MDYDRWGFYLGIAFFILSVPLSIATNAMSPKILNWYGQWRFKTKVGQMTALLADLKRLEAIDPVEEFRRLVLRILSLIVLMLAGVVAALLTWVVPPWHPAPSASSARSLELWSYGIYVVMLLMSVTVNHFVARSRALSLPRVQKQIALLEKQIF